MANVDMSCVLSDPDFLDYVVLIRRTSVVNEYGENAVSETSSDAVMVVQPASPDDLQRLPDSVRMREAIHVWYYGELAASASAGVPGYSVGVYPDVIEWDGLQYEVSTADNFGNWGSGYTDAIATLVPASLEPVAI